MIGRFNIVVSLAAAVVAAWQAFAADVSLSADAQAALDDAKAHQATIINGFYVRDEAGPLFREALDRLAMELPDDFSVDESAGIDQKLIAMALDRERAPEKYAYFWEMFAKSGAKGEPSLRTGRQSKIPPLPSDWYQDDKYRLVWECHFLAPDSSRRAVTAHILSQLAHESTLPTIEHLCDVSTSASALDASFSRAKRIQDRTWAIALALENEAGLRTAVRCIAQIDEFYDDTASRLGIQRDEFAEAQLAFHEPRLRFEKSLGYYEPWKDAEAYRNRRELWSPIIHSMMQQPQGLSQRERDILSHVIEIGNRIQGADVSLSANAQALLETARTQQSTILEDYFVRKEAGPPFRQALDDLAAELPDDLEVDESAGFDEKLIAIALHRKRNPEMYNYFWEMFARRGAVGIPRRHRSHSAEPLLPQEWYSDEQYRLNWECHLLEPEGRWRDRTRATLSDFANPATLVTVRHLGELSTSERAFEAYAEDGKPIRDLQNTMWGLAMGIDGENGFRMALQFIADIERFESMMPEKLGKSIEDVRAEGNYIPDNRERFMMSIGLYEPWVENGQMVELRLRWRPTLQAIAADQADLNDRERAILDEAMELLDRSEAAASTD